MLKRVENIKFTHPEHYRQIKEKAKKQCAHLKGIKYVTQHYGLNESVSIAYCRNCDKELGPEEISLINKTLKIYEQ
jgi:hypothetical protein